MNANKHNIFFYKDFVDDAGASVTADKAKYIFAVRFDLERKQVAINYPLGDLDGQSNYYKGKKNDRCHVRRT